MDKVFVMGSEVVVVFYVKERNLVCGGGIVLVLMQMMSRDIRGMATSYKSSMKLIGYSCEMT
jgi:hypothetical protein